MWAWPNLEGDPEYGFSQLAPIILLEKLTRYASKNSFTIFVSLDPVGFNERGQLESGRMILNQVVRCSRQSRLSHLTLSGQ